MSIEVIFAEALKEAGWALYDAALHASDDTGQVAAFDAATKIGDVLIEQGYVLAGQEIKKAVADY